MFNAETNRCNTVDLLVQQSSYIYMVATKTCHNDLTPDNIYNYLHIFFKDIPLAVYGAYHHFQYYFRNIVEVSFIGGGNPCTRRKPPTCRKSLTNFIT
jgi:hypothetical protein